MLQSSSLCIDNIVYFKFELATLRNLQGESQVYVFHLLIEVGFRRIS